MSSNICPLLGCFGMELKTGGIIIGWLGMLISIFQIAGASIIIETLKMFLIKNPKHGDEALWPYMAFAHILGFGIIYMLINATLLYGSYKKKKFFLVPWLIGVAIFLIIFLLAILAGGGASFSNGQYIVGIVLFTVVLPISGLQAFFWYCIYRLYQKFHEEEERDNNASK